MGRRPFRTGCLVIVAIFVISVIVGVVESRTTTSTGGSGSDSGASFAPSATTRARRQSTHQADMPGRKTNQKTAKGPNLTMTCCSGGKPVVYAGLGAPAPTFTANNEQAPPNPAGAPTGIAWYTVDSTTAAGRVTAYTVTENAQPAMTDRERMGLAEGLGLPDDAQMYDGLSDRYNNDTCIVWQSRKLQQMVGMKFAAITTIPGTNTADSRAEPTPSC